MKASHELVPLEDRKEWSRALRGVPHGFTHTWQHSHALHLTTGLPSFLYRFEKGRTRIVCPLSERVIGNYTDIVTPPGPSGFTGTHDCPEFPFHWAEFVSVRGYVCGYIGLNPLFDRPCYREKADPYNTIYVLNLRAGPRMLFARMDRNRRRELRSWDEISARLVLDRAVLTDFLLEHYESFLRRVQAAPVYHLSSATLAFLSDLDTTVMVGAGGTDRVEAVYLFTHTPYAADCFLNVALPEGRRHTTALVWYGVTHFQRLGIPVLHMGGGLQDDDRIAHAKRRFGATPLPLRSLKQVYRPDVYAELCGRAGVDPGSSRYFPAYRSNAAIRHVGEVVA